MTYDQAQSPRLGQRSPVESTSVRMFLGEEIPEAAWNGQLIYRRETQNLQIYDSSANAWLDITGGIFGLLTFVGPNPPPISVNVGDIWFNTDEGHHQYRAASIGADEIATGEWESVQDDAITEQAAAIEAVQGQSDDLSSSLEDVAVTAFSAQNAANTADGRISMSDYEPAPDDALDKNEGSLWFTRTRPRSNLADNPSVEVDTSNWVATAATIARINATPAIDGAWVLAITNSAAAGDHSASWSSAARQSCAPGQTITASVYADLVTGAGTGATLRLLWYDSAGSPLSTSQGDPVDLLVGTWQRPFVSDIVPTGAVSFYVQASSPTPNDLWRIDGLVVEQSDELGRYFDGSSSDASWDGTPELSTSTMVGDNITAVFELHNGDWVQKWFTESALVDLDAAKLTHGVLNGGLLGAGTVLPFAMNVTAVTSSEALTAGDLVNVWSSGGATRVRKASAAAGQAYAAHGFVLVSVASGATVGVYYLGYNPFCVSLSPGDQFLSATPGKATANAPVALGCLIQRIGFAPSSTVLNFQPMTPVLVTT